MSQRIANVNANFINPSVDPTQTNNVGGIEGIVGGVIVTRNIPNGPSGLSEQQPFLPITVTHSITVT
jgi:hypothetical protein